jgi:hypothetical protein
VSDIITGFIYLGAAALSGHWLPFAILSLRGLSKLRKGWEEIRYYRNLAKLRNPCP